MKEKRNLYLLLLSKCSLLFCHSINLWTIKLKQKDYKCYKAASQNSRLKVKFPWSLCTFQTELWATLLHGEASCGHCIKDEDQRKLLKYLSRRNKNYPTHVKHWDFICLLKISCPLKIVFSVQLLTCLQFALQLGPRES